MSNDKEASVELVVALRSLFAAGAPENILDAIEAHPILREEASLAYLAAAAERQHEADVRTQLRFLLEVVTRCKRDGIEATRRALTGTSPRPSPDRAGVLLAARILELINGKLEQRKGPVWAALQGARGVLLHTFSFITTADDQDQAIGYLEEAVEKIEAKDDPEAWALFKSSLGSAYAQRRAGDRSDNLEAAIAALQDALSVFTSDSDPFWWADTRTNLGNAYHSRLRGDRETNVELALAAHAEALTVYSLEVDAEKWAVITNNLGNAYCDRVAGDRSANVELAINSFLNALTVRTEKKDPQGWAVTQTNLGRAFLQRIAGTSAENVQLSIQSFERALSVLRRDKHPLDWASAKAKLGEAFLKLPSDSGANIERGIAELQEALTVLTPTSDPEDWADVRAQLGQAYRARVQGERRENLEEALAAFEDALQARTRDRAPESFAVICNNLGISLLDRLAGDRAENVERAISCFESALTIYAPGTHPNGWATAQVNLGSAYRYRKRGDRAENIERSIAAYERALTIYTTNSWPTDWAMTQNNLGSSYRHRLRGDRAENIERAIAAFQDALNIFTREADELWWARVQNNLAAALFERLYGAESENIENAIGACQNALTVYTKEQYPDSWAILRFNLGNAYYRRTVGDAAENIKVAIGAFEEAVVAYARNGDNDRWISANNNLATAHLNRIHGEQAANIDQAISLYERSLVAFDRESDSYQWALICANLGDAYVRRKRGNRRNNLRKAISAFEDAASTGASAFMPDKWIAVQLNHIKALMQLSRKEWPSALKLLDELISSSITHYLEATTPHSQMAILSALGEAGRLSAIAAAAGGDFGGALERLEAARCVGLRDVVGRPPPGGTRDGKNLELMAARRAVSMLRMEAASESANDSRRFAEIAEDLRNARAALSRTLLAIGEKPLEAPKLTSILNAIPPAATVIVPIATRFGGLIFVLPSGLSAIDEGHCIACPRLTADVVRQQTRKWLSAYYEMESRRHIPTEFGGLFAAASTTLESILAWAGDKIIRPALASITNKQDGSKVVPPDMRIIIVPTGEFALLPLHAAQRKVRRGRRALLEDFIVTYAPNVFSLKEIRPACSEAGQASDRLLALINPAGDLIWSEAVEAPVMRQLFPDGAGNAIRIRDEATKESLVRDASFCTHLHLSCHGSFDWVLPERSGLELADTSTFTIPEVAARLSLDDCRWVMLSACETGISDTAHAPDEMTGHATAFLQAGAAAVTATLWAVTDASTSLLVTHAYRQHLDHGLRPAEAMRNAALWLRDLSAEDCRSILAAALHENISADITRGFANVAAEHVNPGGQRADDERPFASPLYWAPFATWGI